LEKRPQRVIFYIFIVAFFMENLEQTCASLRAQIAATEAQLAGLKRELEIAEQAAADVKSQGTVRTIAADERNDNVTRKWPLLGEEYKRYGRQMIVPQLGLQGMCIELLKENNNPLRWLGVYGIANTFVTRVGQLKLRSARVLIVGAGGLGCPAALYLAGAGVGTLGLVDGDTVENSNLHRQVLHRSKNVGKFKVDSAIEYLRESVQCHPHRICLGRC
jgi:adenylyltransferase/sulfurtransferase